MLDLRGYLRTHDAQSLQMSKPSLLEVWGDCSGGGGIAAGWEAKAPRGTSLALQNLTLGCSETKLSGPPVL